MPEVPQVLAKTSDSISLRLSNTKTNGKNYKLGYSKHGYVYYSWDFVECSKPECVLSNLEENTYYVVKLAIMDPNTKLWSAFSEISTLIRTFTKEESTQRKTTYYEHALRMEKEQSAKMQTQITKLAQVLGQSTNFELEKSNMFDALDNIDALLKSKNNASNTDDSVAQKLLMEKEKEVENIMQDCRRLVQEQADAAQAKQFMLQEALTDAKSSLETQVNMNALLRNELAEIGPEYQAANATIDKLTSENIELKEALQRL